MKISPMFKFNAVLALFVVLISSITWALVTLKERDHEAVAAYRTAHHCVRNGFAGKDATPTYVCNTGFILETEMPDLAEQEGLNEH